MSVNINAYGSYSPYDIKNRASIPAQSDMVVGGVSNAYQYKVTNICQPDTYYFTDSNNQASSTYLETGQWTTICSINELSSDTCFTLEYLGNCSSYNGSYVTCNNIKSSDVHNVLQSAQYGVVELCTSPRVNRYSNFGPREWVSSGGVLTNNPILPDCSFDDFSGYNHNAPAPTIAYYITGGTFSMFDSYVRIYVDSNLGETDWFSKIGATKLWLEVKVDNSLVATGWTAISTTRNYDESIRIWCDIPTISYNDSKVAICKLYFTNTSNNMLGYVPGIIEFEVYLKYNYMGYEYYLNNTCAAPLTYDYTNKYGAASVYLGAFSSTYICSRYEIQEQTGDCLEITFSSMGCAY